MGASPLVLHSPPSSPMAPSFSSSSFSFLSASSRYAKPGPKSNKSSTSSHSKEPTSPTSHGSFETVDKPRRARPRSPPSMYVAYDMPAPKAPKPLLKLDKSKKPKRKAASPPPPPQPTASTSSQVPTPPSSPTPTPGRPYPSYLGNEAQAARMQRDLHLRGQAHDGEHAPGEHMERGNRDSLRRRIPPREYEPSPRHGLPRKGKQPAQAEVEDTWLHVLGTTRISLDTLDTNTTPYPYSLEDAGSSYSVRDYAHSSLADDELSSLGGTTALNADEGVDGLLYGSDEDDDSRPPSPIEFAPCRPSAGSRDKSLSVTSHIRKYATSTSTLASSPSTSSRRKSHAQWAGEPRWREQTQDVIPPPPSLIVTPTPALTIIPTTRRTTTRTQERSPKKISVSREKERERERWDAANGGGQREREREIESRWNDQEMQDVIGKLRRL
ncbi:hypothetical protein C8R47DRAFT_1135941 [Mycena vitilis]|nr:hypothetical protein C8R47DRAFT_1135941 [Mycena vitilis]